ncbi:MAG: hypothetical protein ABSA83_21300 [Verrucomicrobiota bacterium]|jgi:integrase
MASINGKSDSPYWWAWFRNAAGKQCSKSTKILREPTDSNLTQGNREAAMSKAEEFERQEKAGMPAGTAAMQVFSPLMGIPPFKKFTRDWITGVGGDVKYHNKLSGYFDKIDEFLGDKIDWQISRLHRPDFAGLAPFISEKGYVPTTVTAHLKTLRQAFLAAQQQGFVLVSPITPRDYISNPSPNLAKRMTILQIEYLANATKVIDWRTTIIFGFYFAMDLIEAANQMWDNIDFVARTVSWVSHTRDGKPIQMTIPMHPLAESHLTAVKKIAATDAVTPSIHGMSDSALRAHFRQLVEASKLPSGSVKSRLNKTHFDLQFSSLKLSFAQEMGHPGLFRLSRFLRSMSAQELEKKVASLPHFKLTPLLLLGES